jgi:hypothetical protein
MEKGREILERNARNTYSLTKHHEKVLEVKAVEDEMQKIRFS